jgi:hypothetical protein
VAFGVVALVACVPMFVLLRRVGLVPTGRRLAAIIGATTASLSAVILIVLLFGGGATVRELVRFWWANLGEFAGGVAPFAVAGAVFGVLWTWPEPLRPTASRGRRA